MKLCNKTTYGIQTSLWTINLKSFEIFNSALNRNANGWWTINLKSFEIHGTSYKEMPSGLWTINLKSFEILPLKNTFMGQLNEL